MVKTKAQSSAEFMIVMGTMVFIFVGIIGFIGMEIGSKDKERKDVAIKEIGLFLHDEIQLAESAEDGYSRNFVLPRTSLGDDYAIEIVDELIYVKTNDDNHALSLPTFKVYGTTVPVADPVVNLNGANTIYKSDGKIYLNAVPPAVVVVYESPS